MGAEEARINTANADLQETDLQMDLIIVSKQFWMLDCFLPPTISTSGPQKHTQKLSQYDGVLVRHQTTLFIHILYLNVI